MSAAVLETQATAARERLRSWVREEVASSQAISLGDLVSAAIEHFGEDSPFLIEFARESLRRVVYQEAQIVLAATRLRGVAKSAKRIDWRRWMEHVGDRHVRLLAMTAVDLEAAASERRGRAATEVAIANFFDHLRTRLAGPTVPVAAHWSLHEIDAAWRDANGEGLA